MQIIEQAQSLTVREMYCMELANLPTSTVNQKTIEEARTGNKEAQRALIENCLGYVYGAALHYTESHPNGIDVLMDLVQAGNEAMIKALPKALQACDAIGYLKTSARHAINLAWIEDRLIRVCRSQYQKGRRAPQTVSLDTPLSHDSDLTLADLIEA